MNAKENLPITEEKDAAETSEEVKKRRSVLAAKLSEVQSAEELKEIEEQLHDLEKGKK